MDTEDTLLEIVWKKPLQILADPVALAAVLEEEYDFERRGDQLAPDSEQASEGATLYDRRLTGAHRTWRRLSQDDRGRVLAAMKAVVGEDAALSVHELLSLY